MTQAAFPPHVLECPDPDGCTVEITVLSQAANSIPEVTMHQSSGWFRVYDAQDGHSHPNPGHGDTRFAPFNSLQGGTRVPTMYLAESLTAALLETSLHDIHVNTERTLAESTLHGKLHAQVKPPRDLGLADLRDDQLKSLGISRAGIASSSPEHYPCTRTVARVLHDAGFDGLLWHSRQAEMTGVGRAEAAVIFCDRVPYHRGSWNLTGSNNSYGSLLEGSGRLKLDRLAEELGINVTPRVETE